MLIPLAIWLTLINLLTVAVFGLDKHSARRDGWRISERRLLYLAFSGGWPGAKLAQRLFRHKTRKMPFAQRLNYIPLQWLLIVGTGMVLWALTGYVNGRT